MDSVSAALAEEHLSTLEGAGESCPVLDGTPTANVQVLWLDVLESHEARSIPADAGSGVRVVERVMTEEKVVKGWVMLNVSSCFP